VRGQPYRLMASTKSGSSTTLGRALMLAEALFVSKVIGAICPGALPDTVLNDRVSGGGFSVFMELV
jgi:hypothetical protein